MDTSTRALVVADRVYRLLLFAYPRPFRDEYGGHMARAFRDQCRQAIGQTGLMGLIGLWLALVPDLISSALVEHIWEVFNMPVEKFLRNSGLAAIVAGILWISLFVVSTKYFAWDAFPDLIAALIYIVIMLLFALGLMGLQRHYPSRLHVRISFAVVYVSIAWLILGGLVALFSGGGWTYFISGFFIFAFGLTLIGVSGFVTGSFSPWAFLLPLIALCLIGFIVTGDEPTPPIQSLLGIAYGLGWVILGVILHRLDSGTPDSVLPA